MTTKTDFQVLFDNGIHVGHKKHKWNPRMKRYLHGERNGVHIIDLEKTVKYLKDALAFISKIANEGKTVIFVSTKPQSMTLIEESAKACRMPYVNSKWIPGLLTNFSTIKTRIKYLADLKEQKATGDFDKYTKKESAKLNKTIAKLENSLGGVQNMKSKPDAVFVVDVVRDNIVVQEARKLGIPIVGIVDSNSNPDEINYPIPGNDDAITSLTFFIEKMTEVINESRKSKK